MLSKLSRRNARRSAKDYAVYMITMIIFAALLFAFNSMLLSRDVAMVLEDVPLMAIMVGLATFFIILIIAWLIRYMVFFMLGKRSREFGIYLLIGMKNRQIAKLFWRENLLMGCLSFLLGLVFGLFLQQALLAIFYSLIGNAYSLALDLNPYSFLMTIGLYFGCYLLALWRSKKKFRKMNIRQLMTADNHNQPINEKGDKGKQWLFFLSLAYIAAFYFFLFRGGFSFSEAFLATIGFIIAIYLIYLGLSSFVARYIRSKRAGIYKSGNLFLLRQFSGKIKTMPFTMGTLTVLFALAMVGLSIAMMFSDYLDKQLPHDFPFAVSISHPDPEHTFTEEIALVTQAADVRDIYPYAIYQNGTNEVNTFLYTNLRYFGDALKAPDGTPDRALIKQSVWAYYQFDTFMKLSDYNYLRKMLGHDEISLGGQEYLLHLSARVHRETGDSISRAEIKIGGLIYDFAGIKTEGFGQDGHNGADYLIIVPDAAIAMMEPYYGRLVMDIENEKPGLQSLLDPAPAADEPEKEDDFFIRGYGTKQIMVHSSEIVIRADVVHEVKYILSSIIFPLFYIAMVYLCVALTVLSVQQLSDSNKYKFRYAVLSKLGLNGKDIDKVIWKQLLWYYLCPIIAAILISAVIILFASELFVRSTGVNTAVFAYFGVSAALLFGIYALYFAATYVLFKRNIHES